MLTLKSYIIIGLLTGTFFTLLFAGIAYLNGQNFSVWFYLFCFFCYAVFGVIVEIVWFKLRKKGHKDLWEVLQSKFSQENKD